MHATRTELEMRVPASDPGLGRGVLPKVLISCLRDQAKPLCRQRKANALTGCADGKTTDRSRRASVAWNV